MSSVQPDVELSNKGTVINMTPAEIQIKRRQLDAKIADLELQIKHVKLDREHLFLECKHFDKYETNYMGRDPGGAHCPDCGKSW